MGAIDFFLTQQHDDGAMAATAARVPKPCAAPDWRGSPRANAGSGAGIDDNRFRRTRRRGLR